MKKAVEIIYYIAIMRILFIANETEKWKLNIYNCSLGINEHKSYYLSAVLLSYSAKSLFFPISLVYLLKDFRITLAVQTISFRFRFFHNFCILNIANIVIYIFW